VKTQVAPPLALVMDPVRRCNFYEFDIFKKMENNNIASM
jgi:hypothetical protein